MAFVDVRMPPGWDGIETIARLWEVAPDLQVVVCTAYSDYSLDEITQQLGHSDQLVILKKPFDNIEALQLAQAYAAIADGGRLHTPRFVRAFELAREVRRSRLDARIWAWSTDWSEGFRRGTIATQMMGAWLAGHMNSWLAPGTRGLWRAAPLPEGSFAAFGGSFFAIPRGADPANKPLAWALLQMLTMDRGLQLAAFKAHDAFPALVDTYDDPFFDEPIPFLGNQPARRLWRETARHITAPAVSKQDAFAEEVVNTELDKVLDRGKDIASALGDAERLLLRRANR